MPAVTVTLTRILGNELPPRDLSGSRLDVLQYILRTEPDLPGCRKLWLLNSVYDQNLLRRYMDALYAAGQTWIEQPVDLAAYRAAKSRTQRIVAAIRINEARNRAIWEIGGSEYVLPFDGDCFMTLEDWDSLQQVLQTSPKWVGIPCGRYAQDGRLLAVSTEPMLGFRKDAGVWFESKRAFGDRSKLATWAKIKKQGCQLVANCRHVATGEERTEKSLSHRGGQRKQSLDRLLKLLDARVRSEYAATIVCGVDDG